MIDEQTRQKTLEAVHGATEGFKRWVAAVRPSDGRKGCFRHAIAGLPEPNLTSTFCVLQALKIMGILEEVFTPEDRTACLAWIDGMDQGGGQYWDPALFDRRPTDLPADVPFPSPAMRETINGYARAALRYLDRPVPEANLQPPAGWPQADDGEDRILEWVTTRPWYTGPWGGLSHMNRPAVHV